MKAISLTLLLLAFAACAQVPSATEAARFRQPAFDSEIIVNNEKLPLYRNVKAETRVPPVYPLHDRNLRATGEVAVGAVVEEDGRVSATFVIAALGSPDMQKAAMAAVMQWRFPPILKDGQKIRYAAVTPITFSIQN